MTHRGLTLLEILAATVLLSLIATAMLPVLATAGRIDGEDADKATGLAELHKFADEFIAEATPAESGTRNQEDHVTVHVNGRLIDISMHLPESEASPIRGAWLVFKTQDARVVRWVQLPEGEQE